MFALRLFLSFVPTAYLPARKHTHARLTRPLLRCVLQTIKQLPMDVHDNQMYWFMKFTSARGKLYRLDISDATASSPKTLDDAIVIYEDDANCLSSLDCLVMGSLSNTQLRVACNGDLYFNEGG